MKMFKAILFDLDGTLLNINMEYFLKKYFALMTRMAAEQGYQGVEKLAEQIWRSTDKMIADKDQNKTDEETFMEDFYRNWHYPLAEFNQFFEFFYREGFPSLNKYCQPFPGVHGLMEKLFKKKLKIVIATNAVFPLTAIQQRLDWAGIGQFNYDLITAYENMHFCKPHLDYYKEICSKIEENPEDCLMVGNDTAEDLIAGKLGIKTFLLNEMIIDNNSGLKPDFSGDLQKLCAFLEKI
jgi:FMN phosphatase YigB (HAD superfamily)